MRPLWCHSLDTPTKKENMKILQAKFLGGEKGFKEYLFFFCYSCKSVNLHNATKEDKESITVGYL